MGYNPILKSSVNPSWQDDRKTAIVPSMTNLADDNTPFLFENTPSLQGKRWHLRPTCERQIQTFTQKLGLSDLAARLLVARQIQLEQAEAFLSPQLRTCLPDPLILPHMDLAISRLLQAINQNERITIFGDYDVDGATSGALLLRFFQMIGIKASSYVPDRMQEGYGPNETAMATIAKSGSTVILMVDCGTTAFEPLAKAKALGLDVIVLDHHQALPHLPEVCALVNPNRVDHPVPALTHLAAVGVSFLFVVGLNRALRESGYFQAKGLTEPNLISLLDLVALGTVCDVMPLTDLNRVFVAQGLKVMAKRENLGLRTLCDLASINEAPASYHLGFILGPRINAGGRVGKASLGTQLLATHDLQVAHDIAHILEELNTQRKTIESEALADALNKASREIMPTSLTLYGPTWHQGIIGIVASRIKESFHRPTLIIADHEGIAKGSGRSITGIDLGAFVLQAVHQGILLQGGGHAMAAGFSIEKGKIPLLRDAFETYCFEKSQKMDLTPRLMIDTHVSIAGATSELIETLSQLEPFGMGNPTPRFIISHVRIVALKPMGAEPIKHLRLEICQDTNPQSRLTAMAFNIQDTPLMDTLVRHSREKLFHVAGTLKREWWQGREQIRFMLEDAYLA